MKITINGIITADISTLIKEVDGNDRVFTYLTLNADGVLNMNSLWTESVFIFACFKTYYEKTYDSQLDEQAQTITLTLPNCYSKLTVIRLLQIGGYGVIEQLPAEYSNIYQKYGEGLS